MVLMLTTAEGVKNDRFYGLERVYVECKTFEIATWNRSGFSAMSVIAFNKKINKYKHFFNVISVDHLGKLKDLPKLEVIKI